MCANDRYYQQHISIKSHFNDQNFLKLLPPFLQLVALEFFIHKFINFFIKIIIITLTNLR